MLILELLLLIHLSFGYNKLAMSQGLSAPNMIQLVSRNPTTNIPEVKDYRNQINFQFLSNQLLLTVTRVLGHHLPPAYDIQKKWKIYSLFYVDPLDPKTGAWDVFIIFAIYLFQIQISLTLGFGPTFWEDQLNNNFYTATYLLITIIFVIDIIINFHKGYYAFGRGKVIDEPELIIKHYLKIYFAMDIVIISTLIIPLIKSSYQLNFIQLIPAVLLYLKKFKCQNQVIGMLQYQRKLRTVFILLMLAFDVLLIGHFGACIFVGIDLLLWRIQYYGNNPTYYWLSTNSMYEPNLIDDGRWILQYIYAQSFSTGTLSTIAPGPFGRNPIQIIYSNFVMIFFMLLASYVLEVLVSILLSQDEIRTFHEDNIQKFDSFMKLKGVKNKISNKIHNFFQLVWETQIKMNVEGERAVLDKLPITLRDQLIVQMQFVKNLKILRQFSHTELLTRVLSLKVSKILLDSDRNLFSAREIPTNIQQRYLFYFKEGLAKFYLTTQNNSQYLISLSNFQRVVGQYQFITGLAYSYSCKSVQLCIVSRLAHVDMMEAIKSNGMLEQFYEIKYRLLIQNQLRIISKLCLICEGRHIESKCQQFNHSLRIYHQLEYKMEGSYKTRRPYMRKNLKHKKIRSIDDRVMIQGHIVMLFMVFQSTRKEKSQVGYIDQAKSYEKYFTQYNPNPIHIGN